METWREKETAKQELANAIEEYETWGVKKSIAEHDYKILLNQETLRMRAEGIAVGIIDKTVDGLKNVAELKLQKDIALVKQDVAKEKINALKIILRILESEEQREYSNG